MVERKVQRGNALEVSKLQRSDMWIRWHDSRSQSLPIPRRDCQAIPPGGGPALACEKHRNHSRFSREGSPSLSALIDERHRPPRFAALRSVEVRTPWQVVDQPSSQGLGRPTRLGLGDGPYMPNRRPCHESSMDHVSRPVVRSSRVAARRLMPYSVVGN